VTLHSSEQANGLELEMTLEHSGTLLDSKTFSIDSIEPDTNLIKAFKWNTDDKGDGKYIVTSTISAGDCTVYENAYTFVNGRQTIPRVTVEDLVPNSQGFSVMLTPLEAVLVDVEYMLMDGSDVIYSGTEKKVPVSTLPAEISEDWNVLLENNKEYSSRVKVKLYSPDVNYIALTEEFTAMDDVFISDTYEDDIGASATIDGISQVPFEGSVRFTVSDIDGNVIESVTTKSPVILNGDDETVETIWTERLATGVYTLVIKVIGNDGDILDVEERIIESDYEVPVNQTNTTDSSSSNQSPGFVFPIAVAAFGILALMTKKQR
ncbi:MAG: hypothetical protein R2741_01620, partial [Methanolobus sp.]